ncbi:adhesion G-protein coupled receptor G7-like [Anabas testudineus]|uniref:adhesion G-protein coupled receptor G7-like n=1 Tax=Anabas testudineus TaxID=64144 RepID=UPI00143CE3B4|nr:adhesion G-protein coupled receptor G7-like [Anabas testudineus]
MMSTTPPITTTPATTPPTSTPVVCLNGGVLVDGVCLCPDEWAGTSCTAENFCEAEVLDKYRFPRTPVGWFAYSENTCLTGTSNAGKPQASTRCSTKTGPPSFSLPPQVLQCDQTLSDIQHNLTSVADLETLAASTQILTSRPEELTVENVTAAAQIVNTLLLSPNATESVRVAAVATVSQLLNTSVPDNTEENDATLSLTLSLDQLSVNLSSSLNTSQSQVVQPNLVVLSAQISPTNTGGVQFTSLTGKSGSFVADRIQLTTNTSSVMVENGFIADALIYVQFPPSVSARQKSSEASLGFVLYQNDRFFRSRIHRRRGANIRVLSASIRGQESSVVPQHVQMLFRPTIMNGMSLFDFACVFWNYSLQDWSTVGCSKGNASDGALTCFCNHTTNFAALWSFRGKYEYSEALSVISIVGLSFSILGLVVTIIQHIKVHFLRKARERGNNMNSKISLLCIYVSLLAFIITFLSGVENSSRQDDALVQINSETNIIPDSDEHVEPDRGSCSAVAALLHFFLLATFMWNSVYGTQLVLLVRTMQHSLPPHWTPVSIAVGWGVPAVVMAITVGATYSVEDPLGYRQEELWLLAGSSG